MSEGAHVQLQKGTTAPWTAGWLLPWLWYQGWPCRPWVTRTWWGGRSMTLEVQGGPASSSWVVF